MLTTLDTLKTSLAGCNADASIHIQIGAAALNMTAADLAQALGVQVVSIKKVRVTSDFLRIRAQPTVSSAEVARFSKDEIFGIVDAPSVAADNYTWAKTSDGRGYIALEFTSPAENTVVPVPPSVDSFPTAEPAPTTPLATWTLPFPGTMRGVGASAGGWGPENNQLDLVKKNNVEVLFICAYEAGQAVRTIKPMRGVGVKHFVLRAACHEPITTAQRFIDLTTPILREYANEIGSTRDLMISVHNEVNLVQEGWTKGWRDGAEFAVWWQTVANAFRNTFPGAKIGFPALSPGGSVPNIRLDEATFIQQAAAAVQAADWIGVHYYWAKPDGSDINPPIAQWRQWFGSKPIVGTEVGPTDSNTTCTDAVRLAYNKFAAIGVPPMAWLLNGAGAWQNAAWDTHGIYL